MRGPITRASVLLLKLKLHDVAIDGDENAIKDAFDKANRVFREQANMQWTNVQVGTAATFAKPGGVLNAAELNAVWNDVRRKFPGRRDVVVFFVKKLSEVKKDVAVPVPGVHERSKDLSSARGLIAVSDLAPRLDETLAHELGHQCGLDIGHPNPSTSRGFTGNIMFGSSSSKVVRETFYRDQIELICRAAPLKLGP